MSDDNGLAARAIAVAALHFGFRALGAAMVLGLAGVFVLEVSAGRVTPFGPAALVIAGWLLWAQWPRTTKWTEPGVALGPETAPALLSLVQEVAKAADHPAPDRVYLIADANAWIGSKELGWFQRREVVMGLGLPLVLELDEPALRSVIAHELGHDHGGDVRLGPWVHGTRKSLHDTLSRLEVSGGWLDLPVKLYAHLFQRVTLGIARRQELAADALAARLAGPKAAARALEALETVGPSWDAYWHGDVLPIVRMGRRPPVVAGWRLFRGSPQEAHALTDRPAEPSAEDTHPPHSQRVAALLAAWGPPDVEDPAPARRLLGDDLDRLEQDLLRAQLVEPPATIELIDWEAVGGMYLHAWRESLGDQLPALAVEALPGAARDPAAFARRLGSHVGFAHSEQGLREIGVLAIATSLAYGLLPRSFEPVVAPGHPLRMVRGETAVDPRQLVRDIHAGEVDEAELEALLGERPTEIAADPSGPETPESL